MCLEISTTFIYCNHITVLTFRHKLPANRCHLATYQGDVAKCYCLNKKHDFVAETCANCIAEQEEKARNSNEEVRMRVEEEMAEERRHWDEMDRRNRDEGHIIGKGIVEKMKKWREEEQRKKEEKKRELRDAYKELRRLVEKKLAEADEDEDED